jgi:hypothetical protein
VKFIVTCQNNVKYRFCFASLLMRKILCSFAFVVLTALAGAADKPAHQTAWPDELVIDVGDIRTRIDGPKMWTMSGLEYQGQEMATQESAYGTVITIRDVGHLGTAHFLEVPGKPGEIEKEDVRTLEFFVDGRSVSQFSPKMEIAGKSFRMERTSKIRDLDLHSTVALQDGMVIETERWHARKPIDLRMTYPLMYAWTPAATHYAFGDDGGLLRDGVFKKEGKSDDGGNEKKVRWGAVFNAANGKGSVIYLAKLPPGVETILPWTDAPKVYRKFRVMSFVETIVPEGFNGTYQSVVGFFEATEADWKERATKRAAELAAYNRDYVKE